MQQRKKEMTIVQEINQTYVSPGILSLWFLNGLIAVQRLFLLDLISLDTGYKMLKKSQPDYVEVLPGIIPKIIREVKETVDIPVFAGGLIRTFDEVESALSAGAEAETTSKKDLW